MPSSALNSFVKNLLNIEYTRKRMEKLYYDDKIVLGDVESVYEALFLRAVTGFEVFLEDLFISILEGRTRYRPRGRVTVRMTAVSSDALKEILLQGNRYMTWLPFDNTENEQIFI
jgi:hypothetical protein